MPTIRPRPSPQAVTSGLTNAPAEKARTTSSPAETPSARPSPAPSRLTPTPSPRISAATRPRPKPTAASSASSRSRSRTASSIVLVTEIPPMSSASSAITSAALRTIWKLVLDRAACSGLVIVTVPGNRRSRPGATLPRPARGRSATAIVVAPWGCRASDWANASGTTTPSSSKATPEWKVPTTGTRRPLSSSV